jgi:hypothetical protein
MQQRSHLLRIAYKESQNNHLIICLNAKKYISAKMT